MTPNSGWKSDKQAHTNETTFQYLSRHGKSYVYKHCIEILAHALLTIQFSLVGGREGVVYEAGAFPREVPGGLMDPQVVIAAG